MLHFRGMLVSLTVLAASSASSAGDESERTRLFNEGKALAETGHYVEAADKFRAVLKIRSAPKAWIALAVVEEKQRRLLAARNAFLTASKEAAAAKLDADRAVADEGVQRVAKSIPHLVLTLPVGLEVRVQVDGGAIVASDIEVDPGTHTIEARAPKHRDFRTNVTVAEAERREVVVHLSPEDSAAGSMPLAAPRGSIWAGRTAPAVLTGASFVVTLIGGGLIVEGRSSYRCDADGMCKTATDRDDADGARERMKWGRVLAPLGAAGMVGGLIWFFATGRESSTPTAWSIAPRVGGASLSISCTF